MLHNKHFEILNEFTGDCNRRLYGRELVGKVSISQKNIALTLDELETEGILTSKKEGNMKFFSLNIRNPIVKDVIIQTELSKKIYFLKKHKKIEHILKGDNRIIGIFGSYARGKEKADSDIDLFVIGNKKEEDYDKKGKLLDLNISIKYFAEKEFIKLAKEKNSLIAEIIKSHIVLNNIESFTEISWRHFYGFD